MVRKISATLCLIVGCLLLVAPTQAKAYSVYDGNISNTYTAIFEDVLHDVKLNEDYLYYRSGQYEYMLVTGDLSYSNNSFTGSNVKIYTITTNTGNYGNGTYRYDVSNENNYDLSVGDYLVYSNLGDYPKLIERGVYYEYATAVMLIVCGLCVLIRSIFGFTYRTRGR